MKEYTILLTDGSKHTFDSEDYMALRDNSCIQITDKETGESVIYPYANVMSIEVTINEFEE